MEKSRIEWTPKTLRIPVDKRRKYKLGARAVEAIRRERAQGATLLALAAKWRVTHKTIHYWTKGMGSEYLPLRWVTRQEGNDA